MSKGWVGGERGRRFQITKTLNFLWEGVKWILSGTTQFKFRGRSLRRIQRMCINKLWLYLFILNFCQSLQMCLEYKKTKIKTINLHQNGIKLIAKIC